MRLLARRFGSPNRLNLTSMLDVTFLLLVFFLLTAQFSPNEGIIPADLPRHGGSDEFIPPPVPLVINVRSTGDDCVISVDSGRVEPVGDIESLYRKLGAWRFDATANPTGLYMADHPIVLKPADETRWQDLVNAMNTCVRAKYVNIQFAQVRPQSRPGE